MREGEEERAPERPRAPARIHQEQPGAGGRWCRGRQRPSSVGTAMGFSGVTRPLHEGRGRMTTSFRRLSLSFPSAGCGRFFGGARQ